MPQLRFGLSTEQWQTIVSNTQGQISGGYQVTQTLRTPVGETLVRWSSTPALDPKGPHSLGFQVYGLDGTFRHWLPDTEPQLPRQNLVVTLQADLLDAALHPRHVIQP